jgi:L-ornithine Nalpha-acyltransferase
MPFVGSRSPLMHATMTGNLRKLFESMRPIVGRKTAVLPLSKDRKHDVVRDTMGLPLTLGRLGSLELRLAITRKDIRKAQRLRYKVFFKEMSAVAPPHLKLIRRDKDDFDRVCDHLLVIDHSYRSGPMKLKRPKVVGTYRLLRQDIAERNFGFYTQDEFGIDALIARHPGKRFLELGRSCVLAPYRDKKTVELLWQGIWAYVLHHKIDVMFGCASLEGIRPEMMKQELGFLHHFARPAENWDASAQFHRYTPMNTVAREAIDPKKALKSLPPLIKGYLRLGAKIGDGAVVDRQFGTTDVLIILPVADIDPRYINYYGPDAKRFAA